MVSTRPAHFPTHMRTVVRATNRLLLIVSAVAIVVMLVAVIISVSFRYWFDDPLPRANDVARIALSICIFAALAPAFERGAHVAIEVPIQRLSPTLRRLVGAARWVIVAAVLIAWCVLSVQMLVGAVEDGRILSGLVIEVRAGLLYAFQVLCLTQFALTALVPSVSSPERPSETPVRQLS